MHNRVDFTLAERVALVTGGATGIGLAAATALREFGATVYIGGRREDIGEESARRIGATYVHLDVTSSDSVDAAVRSVVQEHGRLDVSVHSAGARLNKPAEDTTDEEWRMVFDTNIDGVFRCCRAAGRVMLEAGGGSIINVASMSAHAVNRPQRQAAYNASKSAVIQYTKSLAGEWGDRNVRVNSISPGYTETAMTALSRAKPEMVDAWLSKTPLARFAKPEEIAGAVVYLASKASSFVTGSDIVVDGGYTVW
ncbi:SDR family NAD(P)-dependent oxidoreductase [Demequina lutea]|uniref:NAD(P)-dependent dehydrogenase (Short-subunit alcohol dehydrogenase family) n=1 Tax=Demequina lutea TaxID=431489 RepID=A0A7Y9Z7Z4_9MICO|nr:SDR family oxidoreductase [Demequina lutea]NYI40512.1 NAD(P)-dependent dehydrogenase (short-subunit alcohol dehydrogenase family) [Demequina lutea]